MQALLLEDDAVLSSEIALFLESKSIKTDKAEDGEKFLDIFSKKPYDVFLLDINVPKINGLDICKTIRETNSETPIIIISAYDGIEEKKEAF
jgi:DNA-binding response OmpR family regulator